MPTSMIFDTVRENIVLYALVLVAVLMILILIILGIVLCALCKKIRSSRSHKDGDGDDDDGDGDGPFKYLEPKDLMKIKINNEEVPLTNKNKTNSSNIKNRLLAAVDKLRGSEEAEDDTKKVLEQLRNKLDNKIRFDCCPSKDDTAEPQFDPENGTAELHNETKFYN